MHLEADRFVALAGALEVVEEQPAVLLVLSVGIDPLVGRSDDGHLPEVAGLSVAVELVATNVADGDESVVVERRERVLVAVVAVRPAGGRGVPDLLQRPDGSADVPALVSGWSVERVPDPHVA
jgi:hypothetical protein